MALIVMIMSEALRSGVLYLFKKSRTDLKIILFCRGKGTEITEEWILYACILYDNCSFWFINLKHGRAVKENEQKVGNLLKCRQGFDFLLAKNCMRQSKLWNFSQIVFCNDHIENLYNYILLFVLW